MRRMYTKAQLRSIAERYAKSVIDDDSISIDKTWSSDKINDELDEKQDILTQGDGITIYNSEVSVKVGEGLFFDDSDQVCLNAATRQTLADVANKANTADLIENGKIKTSLLPIWNGGHQ